ncbi:sulfatase-like hydrolase/transferase [bacterium]|nr:sulfatase-like hydrolase/transferase [bacterium]
MLRSVFALLSLCVGHSVIAADVPARKNVLLIVSDDLTAGALSCYGNTVCQTPHIDQLAAKGTRYTRAYCNATYCGPSRASFLSGYYPHATKVFGYTSPRPAIGDRATLPQYFLQHGYSSTRVSKIYHMGVPGDIEKGSNGADDELSWSARFNSQGPEWKAPGTGETLEGNPQRNKPVQGGNTFVVVEADGDDLVHADGKTAAKAVELLSQPHAEPFFLAVGFVRPHVPFVAPRRFAEPFLPFDTMVLPPKVPGDWDDIPPAGINYKTSKSMQMDIAQQKKAIGGYYAAVQFMDAQVGKVLDALAESGHADDTVVVFTSDHGFHLGEHDFWAKVSLHEESARVPLIIHAPGLPPGVCDSFVELIDLYPTLSQLCGLPVPERIQGRDLTPTLQDAGASVRETAFCYCPMSQGFLLRNDRWAYLQYKEDASGGIELFDMQQDPHQYTNLADEKSSLGIVSGFQRQLAAMLAEHRNCDLAKPSGTKASR